MFHSRFTMHRQNFVEVWLLALIFMLSILIMLSRLSREAVRFEWPKPLLGCFDGGLTWYR